MVPFKTFEDYTEVTLKNRMLSTLQFIDNHDARFSDNLNDGELAYDIRLWQGYRDCEPSFRISGAGDIYGYPCLLRHRGNAVAAMMLSHILLHSDVNYYHASRLCMLPEVESLGAREALINYAISTVQKSRSSDTKPIRLIIDDKADHSPLYLRRGFEIRSAHSKINLISYTTTVTLDK